MDKEFQHPNVLWYKTYDEQCLNKPLEEINLARYAALVTTDAHYPVFCQQILMKTANWSNKAVSLFNILEHFNDFFLPQKIDLHMLYMENKKMRKLVVDFQLWILCERFYALIFYSLDSQQFTNDRTIATLTRIFKFFCGFFCYYKKNMFEELELKVFLNKVKQQLIGYQKSQNNRWATILCNNLLSCLNKFLNGEQLQINDYKQEAYFNIVKEVHERNNDNIEDVQDRLFRNYEKKQTLMKNNERKRWDNIQSIDQIIENVKKTYDPMQMLQMERTQREKLNKRPTRWVEPVKRPKQNQSQTEVTNPENKSSATKYPYKRLINKSDNNPFTNKNIIYNTFVQDLVIPDENKKIAIEEKKQDSEVESQEDIEFFEYYTNIYQEMLQRIQPGHAKVTAKDIVENLEVEEEILTQEQKALGKVTDGVWIYYDEDEEYWHTGGVHGKVDSEGTQKYMKILQVDSDDDNDERGASFKKFCLAEMNKENLRNQKYNDEQSLFNIIQSTFQKKKSSWYFLKTLYNQKRIKNELSDLVKPSSTNPYHVYPWNPEFGKRKQDYFVNTL